jgi:hypothetical protein
MKKESEKVKVYDHLPIDYLGNKMTLKLLNYSFYFLG